MLDVSAGVPSVFTLCVISHTFKRSSSVKLLSFERSIMSSLSLWLEAHEPKNNSCSVAYCPYRTCSSHPFRLLEELPHPVSKVKLRNSTKLHLPPSLNLSCCPDSAGVSQ